jgi:hypothetical protein
MAPINSLKNYRINLLEQFTVLINRKMLTSFVVKYPGAIKSTKSDYSPFQEKAYGYSFIKILDKYQLNWYISIYQFQPIF